MLPRRFAATARYFMKNQSRMMIGIGTPTSHRMMERMSASF
jgi:hypothetical protein